MWGRELREPLALLPRVGGLATMPSRYDSLMRALPHILPQLDRLYLYLDQHEAIPQALLSQPKIIPLLPSDKNLGSDGKFMGLQREAEPCLYFCFDDDILYPPDYVQRMTAFLKRMDFAVAVGVHGVVFKPPCRSYRDNRSIIHFAGSLQLDAVVDELGTGTLAFHSASLQLDPQAWAHTNQTDLMCMLEAIRQNVPRLCIQREAGWLRAIAEHQPDSLHVQTMADDRVPTALLQAAVRAYPGAWCQLP